MTADEHWDELLSDYNELKQQNADLLAALKAAYDSISNDPDIYWKGDTLDDMEQAITAAERNQELTQLSEWEAENLP